MVIGALASGVQQQGREADSHVHLLQKLRISGALPRLPIIPSCHAQGTIYSTLFYYNISAV
jgi:hypothetical protein